MKRLWLVVPLYVLTFSVACGKKEPVQKESIKAVPEIQIAQTSALMESEKDQFHPNSLYESIRKKKLTDFGQMKHTAPVSTPDMDALNDYLGAGPGHKNDPPEKMVIPVMSSQMTQGDFTPPFFPFDYENDINTLKRLYRDHHLETVVDQSAPSLLQAKALNIYVYDYFKDLREPTEEELTAKTGPSAFTIAKMKEQGIGGTSIHYAALLCQLGTASGFVTRMISLHTIDGSGQLLTHNVCEFYMSAYRKWVVFDPYSKATYYLRGGVPQNVLELRDLMLTNLYREISPIVSYGDFTDIVHVRENLLPRYKYVCLIRRNDICDPAVTWRDLYASHLAWEDTRATVSSGKFESLNIFGGEKVRYVSHDKDEFYYPINKVRFDVERLGSEKFRLHLDAMMPNFLEFRISIDGQNVNDADSTTKNTYDINTYDFELNIWAKNVFGGISSLSSTMITRQ